MIIKGERFQNKCPDAPCKVPYKCFPHKIPDWAFQTWMIGRAVTLYVREKTGLTRSGDSSNPSVCKKQPLSVLGDCRVWMCNVHPLLYITSVFCVLNSFFQYMRLLLPLMKLLTTEFQLTPSQLWKIPMPCLWILKNVWLLPTRMYFTRPNRTKWQMLKTG